MLINLDIKPEIRKKNVARCKEKGIKLPTFKEMINPKLIKKDVLDKLKDTGLWDVNPVNLYRINWHNERKDKGGHAIFGTQDVVLRSAHCPGSRLRDDREKEEREKG